ncbi:MAG: N-acetylneuraminate synthase family protein, partial [Betaproteobacteria bacterium]|nr:N-acetylneuraminate synthase family protein [Betaproteobacteria bacterium]
IFDPDRLVADKKQLFTYQVLADRKSGKTETVSEPLYDILSRRSMPQDKWRELKKYSDSLGLAFFSTVGFDEDVDFLKDIGCHSVKIASADITHFPLIKYAARSGMSIQIDTGNATLGEVEAAVDVILACGNPNIVIHHCPSGYPARLESINLKIIQTLRATYDFPIAYSDHTPGWDMDIAAIALGANMIEKTITHDRMTRSVEHMFSLEPDDMKKFITIVRELEIAFGSRRKQLTQQERDNTAKIRRSVHVRRAVKAGEPLTLELIDFRRPGFGIEPQEFERFLGMRFAHALPAGHIVMPADLVSAA